jgi:hypothetical protein
VHKTESDYCDLITESNRAIHLNVQALYDLMFNQCQPREAIQQYAGIDIFRVLIQSIE